MPQKLEISQPYLQQPAYHTPICNCCILPFTLTSFYKLPLAGGESLGDDPLQGQFLLLQVIGGGILNLKLSHGVAKS